jgi:hypothetical protein
MRSLASILVALAVLVAPRAHAQSDPPKGVTVLSGNSTVVTISADGNFAAYDVSQEEIHVAEVKTGKVVRKVRFVDIAFNPKKGCNAHGLYYFRLSPTGKKLLFNNDTREYGPAPPSNGLFLVDLATMVRTKVSDDEGLAMEVTDDGHLTTDLVLDRTHYPADPREKTRAFSSNQLYFCQQVMSPVLVDQRWAATTRCFETAMWRPIATSPVYREPCIQPGQPDLQVSDNGKTVIIPICTSTQIEFHVFDTTKGTMTRAPTGREVSRAFLDGDRKLVVVEHSGDVATNPDSRIVRLDLVTGEREPLLFEKRRGYRAITIVPRHPDVFYARRSTKSGGSFELVRFTKGAGL